jgi:hypothetical protein
MDRFKHRISDLIPLHPYTLSSTPPPTHLFLIIAALAYTSILTPITLQNLLDRSMIHILCGATGFTIIQGLLLLSLAPSNPVQQPTTAGIGARSEGRHECQLSPLRLLGMAKTMGDSLNLDAKVRATLRNQDSWGEVWYTNMVEESLMVSRSSTAYVTA